ncbi:hypothetical protein LOB20_09250, partial [Lactobacillus delbrueckii subsp. lactis]
YTTSMKDDPKQMIEEIEAYHHPVRKGRKYPRPLRFQGSVSLNANFPGFYNSMSKKPTITAFFEV